MFYILNLKRDFEQNSRHYLFGEVSSIDPFVQPMQVSLSTSQNIRVKVITVGKYDLPEVSLNYKARITVLKKRSAESEQRKCS